MNFPALQNGLLDTQQHYVVASLIELWMENEGEFHYLKPMFKLSSGDPPSFEQASLSPC